MLNLGESFGRISIKHLIEAIESGQNGLVMCFVEGSQSDLGRLKAALKHNRSRLEHAAYVPCTCSQNRASHCVLHTSWYGFVTPPSLKPL